MKKWLSFLLILMLLCTLTACTPYWEPEQMLEKFDKLTEWLASAQITDEKELIGQRSYVNGDRYIGTYTAQCEDTDGRDVIFGGASVKQRKVRLTAIVTSSSGTATLRIRMGVDTEDYSISNGESYETELSLNGGGNYIMMDYEDFSGTVELKCEYIKFDTSNDI